MLCEKCIRRAWSTSTGSQLEPHLMSFTRREIKMRRYCRTENGIAEEQAAAAAAANVSAEARIRLGWTLARAEPNEKQKKRRVVVPKMFTY